MQIILNRMSFIKQLVFRETCSRNFLRLRGISLIVSLVVLLLLQILCSAAFADNSATHRIIGLPIKLTNGLPGNRDDLYRAGIITTLFIIIHLQSIN